MKMEPENYMMGGDPMFGFRKKRPDERDTARAAKAKKNTEFGFYQFAATGQRTSVGDRGEMCTGAMNNNQRFATLQMLRDMKDE